MIATLTLLTAGTLVALLAALPPRRLVWPDGSTRVARRIDRWVPLVAVLVSLAGAVVGLVFV